MTVDYSNWRAGFEIELVLDDLGEPRFSRYGPMDEASPAYRQALARILSDLTGERWTAPNASPRRVGYYVLPEYDIDPLAFEEYPDLVAGVELVTPPLPLSEAEELRRGLVAGLVEHDFLNLDFVNEASRFLGWHINIDPGPDQRRLEGSRFITQVDEMSMLLLSGRTATRNTGLQRHGFGPPLLRDMCSPRPLITPGHDFENFLNDHLGRSKSFAANFGRSRYVELRHYSSAEFVSDFDLTTLLEKVLGAFGCSHADQSEARQRLFEQFNRVADLVSESESRLSVDWQAAGPIVDAREGTLRLDGKVVGNAWWNGSLAMHLIGVDGGFPIASVWRQSPADLHVAFAVLCLDLLDWRRLGGKDFIQIDALNGLLDVAV